MLQENTTNSFLEERNQIDMGDQLSSLLISKAMRSQHLLLIREKNFWGETLIN